VKLDVIKTNNTLPQRLADFKTLTEALDYAADGVTGCNFFDARGNLKDVLSYKELRNRAQASAQRLLKLGLKKGDRIALIADTEADFIVLFFACRYAGMLPYAMPVPVNLGSHNVYVQQLIGLLKGGDAAIAIAPDDFIGFLKEASAGLESIKWVGTPKQLNELAADDVEFAPNSSDEPAYLQFTSGSTRFPQGVVISEHAIMSNLQGIVRSGLAVRNGDRCASWLPFYHDMGLVGFVLGPIVSQLTVDYIRTRDFAIRPLQWLRLISRNTCTIAFSPPFGYELCARRVREADFAELDLSSWRVAGVGAEMIRPSILENFAATLAPAGFSSTAFLPCYGLAEASLAASFSPLGEGLDVMYIDALALAERGVAVRVRSDNRKVNAIVNCGRALPEHEIKIIDEEGNGQPDLRIGRVLMRGPSLMEGYLNNPDATAAVFSEDGWLDTGDLGYIFEKNLYLSGRRKDVIIVNGRNIRAQDLEELAEEQPEVRMGDASAFGLDDDNENQVTVVLVVECRISNTSGRQSLISRLQRLVYEGFGIHCVVELVKQHTLPRTSSGKLSRVAARKGFMERADWNQEAKPQRELG
jgi:fatty-acyl-CoA synthase